jgi:hypothetical protein
MKSKLLIWSVLLITGAVCALGQDIPQPISRQEYETWRQRKIAAQVEEENARKIQAFRRPTQRNNVTTGSTGSAPFTETAKKYLKTDDAVQNRFKSFLQTPNTGITTLLPEQTCQELDAKPRLKFDKLVERCPYIFIPGGASYFSFRQKDYVNYPLADLGFKDNLIFSLGSLNQGILVDLGDAKIEELSLDSKGIDYLSKYVPATTIEDAAKESAQFESGLKVNDLVYKNVVAFEKNKTYGLRVVAYNLYSLVPPAAAIAKSPDNKETRFYEFANDKREDVIVVFRVVENNADAGVVFLWKELKRTQSPEIMMPAKKPTGEDE